MIDFIKHNWKGMLAFLFIFLICTINVGCSARAAEGAKVDAKEEKGFWSGVGEYLDNHRASMGHDSTFTYTQNGRVEFYGPFPMQLIQANHAWFTTAADAQLAQESTQPVIQQPIIAHNGAVLYPQQQPGQMRVVHISHNVQGFTTQEPAPHWVGNVIHEDTVVPWGGSEAARYDNSWRYQQGEVHVNTDRPNGVRTYNDGPSSQSGRTVDAWGHK